MVNGIGALALGPGRDGGVVDRLAGLTSTAIPLPRRSSVDLALAPPVNVEPMFGLAGLRRHADGDRPDLSNLPRRTAINPETGEEFTKADQPPAQRSVKIVRCQVSTTP